MRRASEFLMEQRWFVWSSAPTFPLRGEFIHYPLPLLPTDLQLSDCHLALSPLFFLTPWHRSDPETQPRVH